MQASVRLGLMNSGSHIAEDRNPAERMPHPRDYSEGGCPAGSLVFLDSTEIHESSPLALVSRRRPASQSISSGAI